MRMILLNPDVRAKLQRLRAHAEANPLTHERIGHIAQGDEPPVGDCPHHECRVPNGVRCVLSLDELQLGKLYRHLSVSVDVPGQKIHPLGLRLLMSELGFRHDLESANVAVYVEEEANAVNVVEPVDSSH